MDQEARACHCGADLTCYIFENLQSVRLASILGMQRWVTASPASINSRWQGGGHVNRPRLPSCSLRPRPPLTPHMPTSAPTLQRHWPPGSSSNTYPRALAWAVPSARHLLLLCLADAVFSVRPAPSHAHIIGPNPAPRAHCLPFPCSSFLPGGRIIHCFYIFLFVSSFLE